MEKNEDAYGKGPNLKKVNPQKAKKFRTKRRYGKLTQKSIIVVQHRSC